jgi:S1-C subfamily serine protease
LANATRFLFALVLLLAATAQASADFAAAENFLRHGEHSEAYGACKSETDAGDAECQNLLGYLFQKGFGVPTNTTEAIRLFRLAAKRGLANAQCHLGLAYEQGLGVAANDAEAVRWYQLAAAQGDPIGEYLLGFSLAEGHGIAKDRAKAIELLRHSADRGFVPAQIKLASLFEYTWGAAREPVSAYILYRIAARTTNNPTLRDRAIQGQNRLIIEFSSQDIISARSVADNWKPFGPPLEFGPLGGRPISLRGETANASAPPKPISSGSGFFVSHEGDLITDHHVIAGCRELRVVRDEKSGVARVTGFDVEADLALLRVPEMAGEIASFRSPDSEKPGEPVIAVGFPLQGLLTSKGSITTGIISALAGPRDDKKLMQITAPVQPGNSGGPLVDNQGNVIGVIVSKLNGLRVARAIGSLPENINFAVKANLARALLDKNGVKYETLPSKTEALSTPDIADKVFKFTALVQCYK